MTTNSVAPTTPNFPTVLHSVGANVGFVQATCVSFVVLPNKSRDPKDLIDTRWASPMSIVQRHLNKNGYPGSYPRSLLSRVEATVSDDLAPALAMMEAVGALSPTVAARILPFGGITQGGDLMQTSGLVAAAQVAVQENRIFVGPQSSETVLAGIPGLTMILETSFTKLIDKLAEFAAGSVVPTTPGPLAFSEANNNGNGNDLYDIVDPPNSWRHTVRYVLELAAVGGLSLALIGRPGSGRTMYARRLISLLPPLGAQEALEVRRLYSAANVAIESTRTPRPFRAPHHTVSRSAMEGLTATSPNFRRAFIPGELSLAHRGVLFLDECSEFRDEVFESVIDAHGRKTVNIGPAFRVVRQSAPADFQLIGAFAPCDCGYFNNVQASGPACSCSLTQLVRYRERVGARVARFVLALNLDRLPSLTTLPLASNFRYSAQVRERVCSARPRYEEQTTTMRSSMPFAQACIVDAILATRNETALTAEVVFDARQLHAASVSWW